MHQSQCPGHTPRMLPCCPPANYTPAATPTSTVPSIPSSKLCSAASLSPPPASALTAAASVCSAAYPSPAAASWLPAAASRPAAGTFPAAPPLAPAPPRPPPIALLPVPVVVRPCPTGAAGGAAGGAATAVASTVVTGRIVPTAQFDAAAGGPSSAMCLSRGAALRLVAPSSILESSAARQSPPAHSAADAASVLVTTGAAPAAAAAPVAIAFFAASAAGGSPAPTSSSSPPSPAASAGAPSSASRPAGSAAAVQADAVAAGLRALSAPLPPLPLSPPDAAGSFLPSSALYVAPSTLPSGGYGLFTRSAVPAETWICEYLGTRLSLRQVMQRSDRTYIICTGSLNSHIDAAEHTHVLARYINDNASCLLNASFLKYRRNKRVLVRSTRAITAGSEIFASYGQGYWRAREKMGMRMQTTSVSLALRPRTAIADTWKQPHHAAGRPPSSKERGTPVKQRHGDRQQVDQQQAKQLEDALLQAEQRRGEQQPENPREHRKRSFLAEE